MDNPLANENLRFAKSRKLSNGLELIYQAISLGDIITQHREIYVGSIHEIATTCDWLNDIKDFRLLAIGVVLCRVSDPMTADILWYILKRCAEKASTPLELRDRLKLIF